MVETAADSATGWIIGAGIMRIMEKIALPVIGVPEVDYRPSETMTGVTDMILPETAGMVIETAAMVTETGVTIAIEVMFL